LNSLVEVELSNISGNHADSTNALAGFGGGILNGWLSGTGSGVAALRVHQSSITDNVAQTGGGVANVDATGYPTRTATVEVTQSTLARNMAVGAGLDRGSGGGLYNSNGSASVVNSTVSGNQAVGDDPLLGGRGGGIGNVGRGMTTTLQILNSTVAFNEATQAGGGIAVVGQVTTTETSMDAGNTLVVSNELSVTQSISNQVALATIAAPQVIAGTESCSIEDGVSNSLGGNIEDGATCGFTTGTDLENTAVVLDALADNGGPTPTHLISEDDAAFNRGVAAICEAAPVDNVDQRGVSRPQRNRCDVGAVELVIGISEMYFPEIYLHHNFSR
jgi:hypothetical protein